MRNRARRGSWSMPRPGPAAVSAALTLGLLAARVAAVAATPAVTLSHPWMRILTPRIPAAGYFTLHNDGGQPLVLTHATSPDCSQLMLHRSVETSGTARMEMVPAVTVPPHGAVTFQPGGYHLMCMLPSAAIVPGKSVPVSLRFRDGSALSASFPVYGARGN